MKKILLLFAGILFSCGLYAQSDTLYLNDGIVIADVKEVLPDAVKFSYPGEDHVTTVYKNVVQKIKYKSGRVETFAESKSLKPVKSAFDWENVTISMVESEVKGLFKIDNVSSKAKGFTTISNMDRVKDRSYKKLKIEAAMLGANIIYLTNEHVQGNVIGTEYQAGNSTETNLSGIAYSNVKPKLSDFTDLLSKTNQFRFVNKLLLGRNSTDIVKSTETLPPMVILANAREENEFIYVNSTIKTEKSSKFRVTYFDDKNIVLMYRDGGRIYNLILAR